MSNLRNPTALVVGGCQTGGRNHFTNLLQLVPEIERLIQAETRNAA